MKLMTKKKIMELLKSGDFTIAYHDNASPCLYKGKHKYENLPEEPVYGFEYGDVGYTPEVVYLLAKALGGVTDSI